MPITFSDETELQNNQYPVITFDDIYGQRKVKEQLRVIAESARKNNVRLGHILISGGTSQLREMLAEAVTAEYGKQLRRSDFPKTLKPGDMVSALTTLFEDDVLFLASFDTLLSKKNKLNSDDLETLLYKPMEFFSIDFTIGTGPSVNSIHLDLPRFSLIGGTASAKSINPETLNRFDYIVELADFDYDERVAYVKHFLKINDAELDIETIESLALECQQEFELKSRLNHLRAQHFCRYNGNNSNKLLASSHFPAILNTEQHDSELEQKSKELHEIFAEMMEHYPKTGIMERKAFDSLLKDFFPSMPDISFLLGVLHENGIMKEMRLSPDSFNTVTVKYAKMLINQYAVRPSIAIAATKLWENWIESSK